MSRSVFRIELIFVCDAVKGVQLHPYAEDVQLSVPICYEDLLTCGIVLVRYQWTLDVRVYLWTLNSIPFTYGFLFISVPCSINCSFVVNLKLERALLCCFFSPLHYIGYFLTPCISIGILESAGQFLLKKKKGSWNFDRGCIESVDQFGDLCHLSSIQPFDPWAWDDFSLYFGHLFFPMVFPRVI